MKKADIQPGLVYLYDHRGFDNPVVFLNDLSQLVQHADSYDRRNGSTVFQTSREARPARLSAYGNRVAGYPALTVTSKKDETLSQTAERLQAKAATVKLDDMLAATKASTDDGFEYILVSSLPKILGEYEPTVTARREEEAQAEALRQARRERIMASCDRNNAIADRLAVHGVTIEHQERHGYHSGEVRTAPVSLDDLEKVLGLLESMAVVADHGSQVMALRAAFPASDATVAATAGLLHGIRSLGQQLGVVESGPLQVDLSDRCRDCGAQRDLGDDGWARHESHLLCPFHHRARMVTDENGYAYVDCCFDFDTLVPLDESDRVQSSKTGRLGTVTGRVAKASAIVTWDADPERRREEITTRGGRTCLTKV
ncbi:hypothetical protein [Nonomuraea typhae]|uniref:hypothetical protein n=1 Tax=Nonomuraea typhae TaxID=2603600 RepID=UPI0012F87303|nr:hypothetical protein [Nonomuraea typhae]